MSTLTERINAATKIGYTENFKITSDGLTDNQAQKFYSPSDIRIPNFYRYEGISDPEDNTILYLIETKDGRKGLLVDAYGAYSDETVSSFIKRVHDIDKQTGHSKA